MAQRERDQGSVGQGESAITRTFTSLEATQPQTGSLARRSHLWPAAAGSRERFHPLQKMDTNRSISQGSQGPGSWGRTAGRLSIGPGSTRRKELKEILLQTNSPGSTKRFSITQKTFNSSSLLAGPHQEQKSEQSPEVLSLALDPLEHEWLLTVAQGDADSIVRLLDLDPSLLTRKDFVTGFTALHWLAKHGHHESFIQVISHAQKKGYAVNVNIPTASGGLTPLHLAAWQGHELLIKVLVGAYGADTSRRDHSGRKAWQYLRADTPRELKELAGALEEDLVQLSSHNTNNNCKSSREARPGQDCVDSGAERKAQHSWSLSTLRNFVRQTFAFFQERQISPGPFAFKPMLNSRRKSLQGTGNLVRASPQKPGKVGINPLPGPKKSFEVEDKSPWQCFPGDPCPGEPETLSCAGDGAGAEEAGGTSCGWHAVASLGTGIQEQLWKDDSLLKTMEKV